MMWILYLLTAYGLCFGFQNKVTILHGVSDFLDAMFACTYCTGFWCGWIAWGGMVATGGQPLSWTTPLSGLMFAFASAAFCYFFDTVIQHMERVMVIGQSEDSE